VKKTQAPPAEIVTVKRMPRALSVPRAAYPEPARRRGLQGEIQLSVTVGTDGAVLDVELKKGIDPELDALAIDALRRARFAPAVGSDGKPMRYTIVYRYVFRLEDES
jgi:protein TonB